MRAVVALFGFGLALSLSWCALALHAEDVSSLGAWVGALLGVAACAWGAWPARFWISVRRRA